MAGLIRDKPYEDQIGYICADANQFVFSVESFDYVIGASILHHLLMPEDALTAALSYLKPGGKAVFFEPFEYGCNFMKTIYTLILDDSRCKAELPEEMATHFQAMIRDYNARFDASEIKLHSAHLDDKWLFTKKIFEDVAGRNGCEVVSLSGNNIHPTGHFFREQLLGNFNLAGIPHPRPPDWALQIADDFDAALPQSIVDKLIIDGTIIIERVAPHDYSDYTREKATAKISLVRKNLRSFIQRILR